MNIIKVFTR